MQSGRFRPIPSSHTIAAMSTRADTPFTDAIVRSRPGRARPRRAWPSWRGSRGACERAHAAAHGAHAAVVGAPQVRLGGVQGRSAVTGEPRAGPMFEQGALDGDRTIDRPGGPSRTRRRTRRRSIDDLPSPVATTGGACRRASAADLPGPVPERFGQVGRTDDVVNMNVRVAVAARSGAPSTSRASSSPASRSSRAPSSRRHRGRHRARGRVAVIVECTERARQATPALGHLERRADLAPPLDARPQLARGRPAGIASARRTRPSAPGVRLRGRDGYPATISASSSTASEPGHVAPRRWRSRLCRQEPGARQRSQVASATLR